MKLRNKKTGEIEYLLLNSIPVSGDIVLEYMDENAESGYSEYCRYNSLAELNEEWEDYKPVEPLIKDEKIRKAVRARAEADGADEKIYLTIDENGSRFANKYAGYIEFGFQVDMDEGLFTIDELCGNNKEEE